MKSYDFDAVAYDGAIYCVECLPDGVDVESDEVTPVFADSEWDHYPTCDACHAEHDYVNLTSDGWIWKRERNWSRAMRDMSLRHREDGHSDYGRQLPSFTSLGGYTIIYVDKEGNTFCGKCANNVELDLSLESCCTYDEGPVIQCDECQEDIESSYGDPDETEETT